jgi:asparagine synthase (glutamine-hydrolysing)
MAGIVGIAEAGREQFIERGLDLVSHRGGAGRAARSHAGVTLACAWPEVQAGSAIGLDAHPVVLDGEIYNWTELASGATCALEALHRAYLTEGPRFVNKLDGPFAIAMEGPRGLFLARDPVGKCPLYLGQAEGRLCFASEIKALAGWAKDIAEFPPGHCYESESGLCQYVHTECCAPLTCAAEDIAAALCSRLVSAVRKRVGTPGAGIGVWLSGGLDSAAMAALASRQVPRLHTFSVGVEGAPDLAFARALADYLGTVHHELRCTREMMLTLLPEVVYRLESFDALLVRSSVLNYLIGRLSSEYVPAVLSGEGGDELFAGYSYLKRLDPADLTEELIDITGRLHNTALQRVDRCSASHGLVARTAFLDRAVVEYALRIPPQLKIVENGHTTEKWILRAALDGLIPGPILWRPKAKFWEGAGVGEQLAAHAEERISDGEFEAERRLPGLTLNTKEELLYYRLFRDAFGDSVDPQVVGRTKGAPVAR